MSDNERYQGPLTASRDDAGIGRGKPPPERPAGKPKRDFSGLFAGRVPLVAAVLVVLVLGALIWRQAAQLSELRRQFDELSSLIRSTDESLSESGTMLTMKIREQQETLDTHWSEIKKLWGASYDRNRKAIEVNTKATAAAAKQAKEAADLARRQQQAVAELQKSLTELSAELQTTAATTRNLGGSALAVTAQLEELQSQLGDLESAVKKTQGLAPRVAETEKALKAMDTYRLQINQQLQQLRQQVQQP